MESKVISVRTSKEIFDRVNKVATRLYPSSYTGLPNRSQLLLDALNLFCDLGEAGALDGMNLSQIDTAQLVYSVNNPREDILKAIQESLARIENNLSYTEYTKKPKEDEKIVAETNKNTEVLEDSEKHSYTEYTNESEEKYFTLTEAWEYAKTQGYEGKKNTFRSKFSRNLDDPNFTFENFRRVKNPKGKGNLYVLKG